MALSQAHLTRARLGICRSSLSFFHSFVERSPISRSCFIKIERIFGNLSKSVSSLHMSGWSVGAPRLFTDPVAIPSGIRGSPSCFEADWQVGHHIHRWINCQDSIQAHQLRLFHFERLDAMKLPCQFTIFVSLSGNGDDQTFAARYVNLSPLKLSPPGKSMIFGSEGEPVMGDSEVSGLDRSIGTACISFGSISFREPPAPPVAEGCSCNGLRSHATLGRIGSR